MSTPRDIAVIGGGLSGLACAVLLQERGHRVRVFEARERPGGRIHSVYASNGSYLADLGPTWVWTEYQPTVARWLDKLNVRPFAQYNEGLAVVDYGESQPPQLHPLPAQHGQVRLVGGPQALIDACLGKLSPGTVVCDAPVTKIDLEQTRCRLEGRSGMNVGEFDHVIVAVPPRIAATRIDWHPPLPEATRHALAELPTWMAPHAKVVALYDTPFWRARGLSGRIASQAGPIMEAHDHSGADGTPAALFGFLGVSSAERRVMSRSELEAAVVAQLTRCFGADAPRPKAIMAEDWATQEYTTTAADLSGPVMHPEPGPEIVRAPLANGRVRFAGAEIARQSAGLIEGAFVAAEHAVSELLNDLAVPG